MMGDNSLRSKDGRLWSEVGPPRVDYFVERQALIGKAIFIYWPHSWHRIPGTPIPFPFFPNFARMGFVR
jgi:signal peptidase I